MDKFTYQGSSVSSTKTDINTRLAKAKTAIYRLSIIRKSNLTDKIKRSFFQVAVVSILLYGCTTWTLTKRMEKRRQLPKNATSNIEPVLEAAPHKAAVIRPLTSHHENYPNYTTRYAGHCWRSRDELISDIVLWIPSHERSKAGRLARIFIQQLCIDTVYSLEDLPERGWRRDMMMMMKMMMTYIRLTAVECSVHTKRITRVTTANVYIYIYK